MTDAPTHESEAGPPLHLQFAALSDVGRVRKDNQDSGYAGPWLLTVCDGVGGAARGDIASSTVVQQLRKLDEQPTDDMLALVAGALHRAHDRIGELVDEQPNLNGTSTTATVALFDGHRLAVGHVGDSRAYLYRGGTVSQLTKDHTFVQSLIDEGRITEEESRTHPHRNLILKAVDGIHDTEPDLFYVDLAPGDRVFLCSDGACGVLPDDRIADILSTGTPDFATVEMVRASLDAGSSDNVTCVVADVLDQQSDTPATEDANEAAMPLLVGAAADLPRRSRGPVASMFRGHRSGDTGELEPVPAEIGDEVGYAIPSDPPLDPELERYAPRPPRRLGWLKWLGGLLILVGLVAALLGGAYAWTQSQYYVSEKNGKVTIFRGVDSSFPGVELNRPYEETEVTLDRLSDYQARQVSEGIEANSLEDARRTVANLEEEMDPLPAEQEAPAPTDAPTDGPDNNGPGSGQEDQEQGGSVQGAADHSSNPATEAD